MNDVFLSYFEYGCKVVWVYDCDYRTRGSYFLDTEEETREAEAEEIAKLESGELVALGCMVLKQRKLDEWETIDSLWGIVTDGSEEELKFFAHLHMDYGVEVAAL